MKRNTIFGYPNEKHAINSHYVGNIIVCVRKINEFNREFSRVSVYYFKSRYNLLRNGKIYSLNKINYILPLFPYSTLHFFLNCSRSSTNFMRTFSTYSRDE